MARPQFVPDKEDLAKIMRLIELKNLQTQKIILWRKTTKQTKAKTINF